ncbi:DUF1573 domain-containing protein [Allorhodopirellula solitaria]|uniref:DUF1573 domain-containing protein n=1 Tax=Allorhodopirellula solitaria TaxID=2527987 RepID=A0A5C5YHC6_9BACT|nr:DUF1573 domain-containing protein [Allorhodopirellula solitaria]TWT74101.1 hypothetical protein CA85_09870 [Allorhodopirellula solitaria]
MISRFSNLLQSVGMFGGIAITSLVVLGPSIATAEWTDEAFPVKSHDFGTVAVASKTEFTFPIVNTTGSEMHIREVRASCGCTTPILDSHYIPAGGKGALVARLNTPTFRGKKGATLTVVIDKPVYSEVQLKVAGYIRSDMVFHPGSVDLGSVNQGEPKSGSTQIFYAGRQDWRVVDVRANEPWLISTFEQTQRGGGKATYELTVQVREDAPAGFFQNEVIVHTNDRSMPRVPLHVSGNVVTALTISPQSIALGNVKPGQELTQRLVIKGREPFGVESIQCEGWDVQFSANSGNKKVHLIKVTLKPTSAQGTQRAPLIITTTGDEAMSAKAIVTAVVMQDQVAATK